MSRRVNKMGEATDQRYGIHPVRQRIEESIRKRSNKSAGAIREKVKSELKVEAKQRKLHVPKVRPMPGEAWMLDQVLAAYLSDGDAVNSYLIAESIIRKAQQGDVNAAQFLAERTQGKPVQKVNLGVQGQLTVPLLDSLLPGPEEKT